MNTNHSANYRPDIDGLRAIAVLSVIAYHLNAQWLPGGFVGVDIFFVISGFVVAASLLHAPQHSFAKFTAFFYARRLLRIAPALIVVLIVSALLATLFIPRAWLSGFSEKTALYAVFGLSNWLMARNTDSYFAPRAEFNPYTHTWSLGVEEQFYLIFPFVFFVWLKWRNRSAVGANALLITLGVASLIASAWAITHAPTSAFYGIVYRFWELAVGVALFQLSVQPAARSIGTSGLHKVFFYALPWIGIAVLAYAFVYVRTTAFPWPWVLLPVIGAACLIGGSAANVAHPVRRFISMRVFVWIGKRSYSLYLWHWPIFVLMRWTAGIEGATQQIIAVVVTLIAATASYRWVEIPFRHNAWLARRAPIVRIALMLFALVLSFALIKFIFHKQPQISRSVVAQNASDWYAGDRMLPELAAGRQCQVALTYGTLAGGASFTYTPSECRDTALNGRTTKLTVVGDSHATAYLAMFDQFSAETGVTVSIYTYAGCSYLDLKSPMSNVASAGCLTFVKALTEHVASSHKTGDVVFLPSLRMHRYSDQWARFDEKHIDSLYASKEFMQIDNETQTDAKQWIDSLTKSGARVLFEAPKPILKSPPFRCADTFNTNNPACSGGIVAPRARIEALRAPIVARMQALASKTQALASAAPLVSIWDPLPTLCDANQCSYQVNGRVVFFDGDHVSGYGNQLLYPSFKASVLPLLVAK
jgi:peptidoglycan/LPS O-acetylase OafA/YrhL